MRIARLITGLLLSCTMALVAGCASTSARHAAVRPARASGPLYYVSLGDSLSQGIQPNVLGVSTATSDGYPDRIYAVLQAHQPAWRLLRLGCSGETTSTMIHGGICHYAAGSQLAEAERFLRDHRGHIGLITIDIGANDPNSCIIGSVSFDTIMSCMGDSIKRTTADLRTIMSGLRAAAGPHVTILAMNYYVPELAGWLDGMTGKEIAVLTERLVAGYNRLLARVYRRYGARIANVFGAFHSADFTDQVRLPGIGQVPRNVAAICEWTWACARWPQGPNEHANTLGYSVIALAFLLADPQLTR
ncbi:MAG TPA: SGNH/GDSL hydrolase family protein [Streptosporangiaceae bacterium]|nr:SGNH/GDSL hydrolase family protein [Streptosporangiaceae bacterium]